MMKKKIYKNGATIIYKKHKGKKTSVSAGFVFGGTIREKYPEPTAHFVEHMLFNGTRNKTKGELKNSIRKTFSMVNASTALFNLELVFCRSNKIIEDCFNLASEMLLESKFNKEDIESEKGVITQELYRQLENPNSTFRFTFNRTLSTKNSSNTSVIGSPEEISKIDAQILEKFVKEIFISQNFVISIEGGISWRKAKKLAEKYFISHLESNPEFTPDKNTINPIDKPGNLNIEQCEFPSTHCSVVIKLDPKLETEKNQNIMSMICSLCNSSNGDFLSRLREKGLVYSSSIKYSNTPNSNFLELSIRTTVPNVNACIDEIGNFFKQLKTIPFTKESLDAIKKNTSYSKDEQTEKKIYPCNLTRKYLTYGDIIFDKKYDKRNEEIFNSITPEDIQKFCQEILSKPENLYVAISSKADPSKFYTYEQMQNIMIQNKRIKKQQTTPQKEAQEIKTPKVMAKKERTL